MHSALKLKLGAMTCPVNRIYKTSELPPNLHLKFSENSPKIVLQNVILNGIFSPTPKIPSSTLYLNIFPKGELFGINSNLASISPRFSIVTSVLNSSVTNISPMGNSKIKRFYLLLIKKL